jgi:hypothetical protein
MSQAQLSINVSRKTIKYILLQPTGHLLRCSNKIFFPKRASHFLELYADTSILSFFKNEKKHQRTRRKVELVHDGLLEKPPFTISRDCGVSHQSVSHSSLVQLLS